MENQKQIKMNHLFGLLSLLNLTNGSSTCDPSSYKVVASCYDSFFQFYNYSISSSMTLPKYVDFIEARGQYELSNPFQNFEQMCTIQNRLTSCLGSAVSCINSDDLLKIFKFHKHDNQEYTGDYYMLNYKCTTAYQYSLNNFNCLATADQFGKIDIENCFNDFFKAPEDKECQAANTLIFCIGNIFSSLCGTKAADYRCNLAKIDMTYDIPQCKDQFLTCKPV